MRWSANFCKSRDLLSMVLPPSPFTIFTPSLLVPSLVPVGADGQPGDALPETTPAMRGVSRLSLKMDMLFDHGNKLRNDLRSTVGQSGLLTA